MTGLGIVEVVAIGIGVLVGLLTLIWYRDKAAVDRHHDLQKYWHERFTDLRTWTSTELTQLSNSCLRRDEIKDHTMPIYQRIDEGFRMMRDDVRDVRVDMRDLGKRLSKLDSKSLST